MQVKRLLCIAAIAVLVGACAGGAPHRVDSEEFDQEFVGQTFSNLLIIGVYKDRTFRVSGETSLAEEFKSRGIAASPSYDLIPDSGAIKSDAVAGIVTAGSFDGILTIATLDPGYDYDAGDYMATRGMVYMLGGEPGAGTDLGSMIAWAGSGLYTLHVGLWDAKTQKPVWQVTTDSESSGSESGDLRTLADFIAATLRDKGLL
ncbi:MAG: hypothetical protein V7744_07345 [Pseudomonadales bacterium]